MKYIDLKDSLYSLVINFVDQATISSFKEALAEYDIAEINEAILSIGAVSNNKSIKEICIDKDLKIITAPCYMMNAKVNEIYNNIKMAIDKLSDLLIN